MISKVRVAIETGLGEVMLVSFPSDLCTEGGRRPNNRLPGWQDRLPGGAQPFFGFRARRVSDSGSGFGARSWLAGLACRRMWICPSLWPRAPPDGLRRGANATTKTQGRTMPGSGSGQERSFYDTPATAGPAQIGVKPAVP